MDLRTDRTSNAVYRTMRIGLICLLLCLGAMSFWGCHSDTSNGGGPEVLQKKFPGGGTPGGAPAASGAPAKPSGANSGGSTAGGG